MQKSTPNNHFRKYFPDWHPLTDDLHSHISPEIRQIIEYARQVLVQNKRDDKALAEALANIDTWNEEIAEGEQKALALMLKEDLAKQMDFDKFSYFLLKLKLPVIKKSVGFHKYEYVALTILGCAQELNKYLDSKTDKREQIQTIVLRLSRFYYSLRFFRAIDDRPVKEQESLQRFYSGIISYVS